jgi:hypothetical protein
MRSSVNDYTKLKDARREGAKIHFSVEFVDKTEGHLRVDLNGSNKSMYVDAKFEPESNKPKSYIEVPVKKYHRSGLSRLSRYEVGPGELLPVQLSLAADDTIYEETIAGIWVMDNSNGVMGYVRLPAHNKNFAQVTIKYTLIPLLKFCDAPIIVTILLPQDHHRSITSLSRIYRASAPSKYPAKNAV